MIIDVRTPAEYAGGHLDGAVLIDVQSPDFASRIGELDRNGSYVVYCRSGARSGMAMQQMIDSWSTERLSVFSTQDQVFTWPASQRTRTLGPSGNFVGNRPIMLDDATYFRDAGTNVSYGIKIINQQQYDGIAVKTVTSTYRKSCGST